MHFFFPFLSQTLFRIHILGIIIGDKSLSRCERRRSIKICCVGLAGRSQVVRYAGTFIVVSLQLMVVLGGSHSLLKRHNCKCVSSVTEGVVPKLDCRRYGRCCISKLRVWVVGVFERVCWLN